MTALGLLAVDQDHAAPDRKLTTYAGAVLAATLEQIPAFRDLRSVAAEGAVVSASELAGLGRVVHPGAIEPGGQEATQLRALLLGTDTALCQGQSDEERVQRRQTLALALDYLAQQDDGGWDRVVEGFRWSVLEGHLGDGRPWQPAGLATCALAWAAYVQNDLVNYALECLLWSVLRVIDGASLEPREVARAVAETACQTIVAREDCAGRIALAGDLAGALRQHDVVANGDPWDEDGTWKLADDLGRTRETDVCSALAVRVLLRVAADRARYGGEHPFAFVPRGSEIVAARDVHLHAWWQRVDASLEEATVVFLQRLVLDWVIYRHLRVATRKLANQGDYTYRFRPEEGRLVMCGEVEPVMTNPRLRQAIRIMADVGLVSHDLETISELGHQLLVDVA